MAKLPPSHRMELTINPTCFMINSIAMGDVIASVPVIKYMIDNFYKDPATYLVIAEEMFRPFFHFVPDSCFHRFEDKANEWSIPPSFAVAALNQPVVKSLTRPTPRHMSLGQFSAIKFANRILEDKDLRYIPLIDVDVSRFGVDFSKAVILVSSHRDATRAWHAESILETAAYIEKRGYIPVFIGKTDMNLDTHLVPKTYLPNDLNIGVDLRNHTTIPELAAIMKRSKAVCGIDSGPIHLAGTTDTTIICGYTSILPEHRIPVRTKGKTYSILPDIPCIGCESRWMSHFWNYEKCYLQHIECCKEMKSNLFINYLAKTL